MFIRKIKDGKSQPAWANPTFVTQSLDLFRVLMATEAQEAQREMRSIIKDVLSGKMEKLKSGIRKKDKKRIKGTQNQVPPRRKEKKERETYRHGEKETKKKMKGTMRRRPTDSFNPPITQSSRDSDASFASSRPSSIGMGRAISAVEHYSDRGFQAAIIRSINAFFSSHSIPPISTKPSQAPSAKDLSNILTSLLSLLHFPCSKLEDDLGLLLKSLNCPFKFNKSTLRAPNTPHNWPTWLGIVHWLVQLAMYNEHLSQNPTIPFAQGDSMTEYALEGYLRFICGEDDLMEVLDKEFMEKLEKERENVVESSRAVEKNVRELEAKAEGLRTGPTEREALENERNVLEEDVKKFHAMIAEFTGRIGAMEKVLEEKKKELDTKIEERRRICEENEELKKRVELQTFNARDVERMKREMQAVERDIGEAEAARNSWEDKSWDLDSAIGQKFKELMALAMECNQAIRRFVNFQFA